MNIRELAALTGAAERQIRYMISEGFVPPPRGGRANADYGDDHAAAIRRYLALREQGFPPSAIKVLVENDRGTPFEIAPGITLKIAFHLLGSGTDPEPLIEKVAILLRDLLKESPDALDDSSHAA